jgi:hypothetical protein
MTWFDRSYTRLTQVGLVLSIWFAALMRAAHDHWAACALFAWLTVLSLLFLAGHSRTHRTIQLPCLGSTILILVIMALSCSSSYDVATSRLEIWIWLFCFVGLYLFVNSIETRSSLHSFFLLSGTALIPLAVLCIYEQWTGEPAGYGQINLFKTSFNYGHWEIHATLINSIVMSGFALYWPMILWEGTTKNKWAWVLFISAAVILILARSSFAGISLGIALLYYYRDYLKQAYFQKENTFLAGVLILGLAFIGVVIFKMSHHHGSHYAGTNRIQWWVAAVKMSWMHPITGVGLGAYGVAYPYIRTVGVRHTLYAHSFPLQFLAETGLPGLLALVTLSYSFARRIPSFKPEKFNILPSRRVLMATLIVILCYAIINISLEYFLNKLMLMLLLGALIERDIRDEYPFTGLYAGVGALVFILLIPLWLTPLQADRLFVSGLDHEVRGEYLAARTFYTEAIRADHTYGDAYAAVARTYKESYRHTRSAGDLVRWRMFMDDALLWKKDIRYLRDLNRPMEIKS